MSNLSLNTQNATPFNTAISVVSAPTVQKMSSKEIADLTVKRHDNVKRDIEVMLTQLNLDPLNFEDIFLDSMNREQKGYALDKELSICLVSGYNVQLRMAIVRRWTELESLQTPKTLSQALYLAAQLEEQKEQLSLQIAQQQQVIEIQKPKAEIFDAVLDKSRTYSIRDFARHTGVKEKDVKNWLIEKRWMTGDSATTYRPAAWSNVHNYMRMIKQGKTFFDAFGVPHYNERIEFTQDGFNEAVRKMVKSGMMKPLAEAA